MSKKITWWCFNILIFGGLLIVTTSDGFAQSVFDREYSEIVQEYKSTSLTLPANIDEYDSISPRESEYFTRFNGQLKELYVKRDEYWSKEQTNCQTYKFFKTKAECVNAMLVNSQNEAGAYLAALKELQKVSRERRAKLEEVRRKFTREQNIRHPKNNYQKIFKDSEIFQNRKPSKRQTTRNL